MQTNNTPLINTSQLIESLQPIHRLRHDYGLDIRYAMNCDINGQNWTLADTLLDAGIEGFSMAINHHFGGPPDPRPNVFLWKAPSGRLLPAHNGWQYSKANEFGLAYDSDEVLLDWLPKIEAYLAEIDYPLPFIILEGFHPYGDNGTAWGAFAEFACRWNESRHTPQIISATPRMFWERVKNHLDELQTLNGGLDGLLELWLYFICTRDQHISHYPQPLVPCRCYLCNAELLAISPIRNRCKQER